MWLEVARDILAGVGGVGVVAGGLVLAAWWKSPHNVELMAAQVARLFAFLGSGVKRYKIKRETQGRLNAHLSLINRWSGRDMPYGVSIEWVRPGSRRESFLRGETVVCRMDYDDNPHLNYLNAALLYVQSGFLVGNRQYLASVTRRAVDLTLVGLMLGKSGERGIAHTYYTAVLPNELSGNEELTARYEVIQRIEQQGFFTNIFLPEMLAYGLASGAAAPRSAHRQEIEHFVDFLGRLAIAAERRNQDANLDFNDLNLQVSIIYVGKPEKLSEQGYEPYIHMIRICKERGAHTVYAIATGGSRESLSRICSIAEQQGYCRVLDSHDFRRKIPETARWMPARVFRLLVDASAEIKEPK